MPTKTELGTGSVGKLLLKLAVPAILAQIVNLLYNIVDRIFIGHIPNVGADALTGMGLCMPVLMLVNAFAMLCGTGGAPRAAISMGQKDNRNAEKIMGNCFALLLLIAVALTALFYGFAPRLLVLFGASENTLPYALSYSRIYILGSIAVMIVNGMNLFLTTQGLALYSMGTVIIGAVCNLILDPVFIYALNLGVKGAALATVISQCIGAVWVLSLLTGKKCTLRLRKENLPLQADIILPCLSLGVSTFVMVATESLLSICFNSSLSKYGGDIAVGAMTVISSISMLMIMPLQGLTQGGQPIISYNFGAGNRDRVKKVFRYELIAAIVYVWTWWILVLVFPRFFAGIFSNDAALIEYTAWAARIYMAGMCAMSFQNCCQQSFVALGQAKISLLLACLRKLILLIPLIYIFPVFLENKTMAVFLAEPVSDILAATVTTTLFLTRLPNILEKGPEQLSEHEKNTEE